MENMEIKKAMIDMRKYSLIMMIRELNTTFYITKMVSGKRFLKSYKKESEYLILIQT